MCAIAVAACSPALNWREVRLPEAGAWVTLPCKPVRRERQVMLAGAATPVLMYSCEADGGAFAVSIANVDDPGRVNATMEAMRLAASENLGGPAVELRPVRMPGMTPNDRSVVVRVEGRAPDGSKLTEHAAFFVKGTQVFQAAVVSPGVDPEAAAALFDSFKFQ